MQFQRKLLMEQLEVMKREADRAVSDRDRAERQVKELKMQVEEKLQNQKEQGRLKEALVRNRKQPEVTRQESNIQMMSSKIEDLDNTLKQKEYDYSRLFQGTLRHETKMVPLD